MKENMEKGKLYWVTLNYEDQSDKRLLQYQKTYKIIKIGLNGDEQIRIAHYFSEYGIDGISCAYFDSDIEKVEFAETKEVGINKLVPHSYYRTDIDGEDIDFKVTFTSDYEVHYFVLGLGGERQISKWSLFGYSKIFELTEPD